jgi:hypothetical protein
MKNLFKILLLIFSNCLFAQGLFTNGFWQGSAAINCVGSFGGCSATCGGGTQSYTITTSLAYGGTACPFTNGATQSCNTQACTWYCTDTLVSISYPTGMGMSGNFCSLFTYPYSYTSTTNNTNPSHNMPCCTQTGVTSCSSPNITMQTLSTSCHL